ncbi:MAG TPA: DMT family transporter, partial [bacterium]
IVAIGEAPTLLGALGIALILVGVFSIAGMGEVLRHGRLVSARGVGWGLATGAFIAVYTIVDGLAIRKLGLSPIPYYVVQLAARNAMMAPLLIGRWSELRQQARVHRKPILVVGLVSPTAYGLVLLALTMAPISYVAPARELSMMLGTVAGMWLLGEAVTTGRLAGVALMASGVMLLNFGG